MSKHPSNNIKSRLLRRGLAGILSLALFLSLIPGSVFTARGASWADPYVNTLKEWGVMRSDINVSPDSSLTRAEFVTMMNRAYGYTKLGGNPFADVSVRDWFYEDIDIAYNIGYFKGTSTNPYLASPYAPLTREQAAVLLARNMMLQPTVGETLGFSDSRELSDWSRGLVGAAVANGIIGGYDDGSYKPFRAITRGEMAAMLVRAIGTPIQTEGEHALGNVYGNVTVTTSGVKLRDGVIAGNLYLTGGIDLGEVLLENVTVLGEIIVSGGGESNSSESSIIMRNVVADNMVVDSISNQFVTLRAEGNTDIPTVTVRTNAYVDDSSLPGYGLRRIILDGEEGALYQLAGNIKEVLNKTPGSDLQVVQGTADKITVDEFARGSSVLVDGDARVGDLNLDTAANVRGIGDIGDLNVGAAGSTVEQLPDKVTIRPGITADIADQKGMTSSQAAESSSDPKLLAGYPVVKSIAPTSATLVFKTNKTGTVYWAVSAVSDGSVSESDLLEPPVYGGNVLASGNIKATSANKEFTAAVSKLTSGGSYYVTAMLVDGRGERSPIKVISFSTPDDTTPAFVPKNPTAKDNLTKNTCDVAQISVMTNKTCLLYYALLPGGATAPTPAEFKAGAVPGNLGYGTRDMTKSVNTLINFNSTRLEEETNYSLFLWLIDHDGAKQSSVVRVDFTTPDETPPIVTDIKQTNATVNSIQVTYTINEPAVLVWALVTEADHLAKRFIQWNEEVFEPGNEDVSTLKFTGSNEEAATLAAKVKLQSGVGALKSANNTNRSPLNITGLTNLTTSSFVLYYIANDQATATGNLSTQVKALRVYTLDNKNPTADLLFDNPSGEEIDPDVDDPDADADARIIFSENVKGGTDKGQRIFLNLYNAVLKAESQDRGDEQSRQAVEEARNELADTLSAYITLYPGNPPPTSASRNNAVWNVRANKDEYPPLDSNGEDTTPWIDWRFAKVEMMDNGTVEVRLPCVTGPDGKVVRGKSALNLASGASYFFHLTGITDISLSNNPLDPVKPYSACELAFTTAFVKVLLRDSEDTGWIGTPAEGDTMASRGRVDYAFTAKPTTPEKAGADTVWDMLIWADQYIKFDLYRRELGDDGKPVPGAKGEWERLNSADDPFEIPVGMGQTSRYTSLTKKLAGGSAASLVTYPKLNVMPDYEYAIHIVEFQDTTDYLSWNGTINIRISYLAGAQTPVSNVRNPGGPSEYDAALANGVSSIERDDQKGGTTFTRAITFADTRAPELTRARIDAHDTAATIYPRISRDGELYYMVISISTSSMSYPGMTQGFSSARALNEEDLKKVDQYSPARDVYQNTAAKEGNKPPVLGEVPRMVGDKSNPTGDDWMFKIDKEDGGEPSVQRIITKQNAEGVIQGVCTPMAADTEKAINLTGLSSNTVYLVLMVPYAGSSYGDIYCYRFTTSMPERPGLTLAAQSSKAVTATVRAAKNSTTEVRAVLINSSVLSATHTLNREFGALTGTGPARDFIKPGLEAEFAAYLTSLSLGSDKFTVLRALRENYINEEGNPSVFEYFANDTVKNELWTLAQTNSPTGEVKSWWGPTSVRIGNTGTGDTGTGSTTMDFDSVAGNQLNTGVDYICLAIAGTGTTVDTYAFRAAYYIQLTDDKPPALTRATISGATRTNGEVTSGDIWLYFDRDLYKKNATGKAVPIYHTAANGAPTTDSSGTEWGTLALCTSITASDGLSIVNDSGFHKINYIHLKVTGTITTPYIEFAVFNICNEGGAGPNPPSITVRFEWDDTNGGWKWVP